MTKSFNSWWDVYAFLLEAPYNSVDVDNTYWWSKVKSGGYEADEDVEFYSSVEESMKALREICDGDVERVSGR